jgi:hypothetical protein
MKLSELVTIDCINALNKLRQSKPPARLAFRFLRIWDWGEPVLKRYDEQRLALLQRHARGEDEPGTFHFRDETGAVDQAAVQAFLQEHAALLEETLDEPAITFTPAELEQFGVDMTVAEWDAIRWMVHDAGTSPDA